MIGSPSASRPAASLARRAWRYAMGVNPNSRLNCRVRCGCDTPRSAARDAIDGVERYEESIIALARREKGDGWVRARERAGVACAGRGRPESPPPW